MKMKKILLVMLLIAVGLGSSCKKNKSFLNSKGATLRISSDKAYVKVGGDEAIITVVGYLKNGEPFPDDILVVFESTLGTVTPTYIELKDGLGTVKFISDNKAGITEIRANAQDIQAQPYPLEIAVEEIIVDRIIVLANPKNLPPGGGWSLINAYVIGSNDNLIPGVPVFISTTAGRFIKGNGVYITNNNGMVEDILDTTETANVTVDCQDKTDTIEIYVDEDPQNRWPIAKFDYFPKKPGENESIFFDATQSMDNDGYIVSWKWNFGDGTNIAYGETIRHSFTWTGNDAYKDFIVRLTVMDNNGDVDIEVKTIRVLR